ncbi:MAG: RNA methyltransferase [Candidatus Tectimicrobiota bacterium]
MNAPLLDAFVVVLVEPQGPANVGSVARAMKNMGVRALRLVNPGEWYGPEARKMAMRGRDVLEAATLYEDLAEALSDCGYVVATTRRGGPLRSGGQPPRELARHWLEVAATNRVALVFGPEDRGLSNQELSLCQAVCTIPAEPAFSSLNLAQAVLLVCYECYLASGAGEPPPAAPSLAPHEELEAMFGQMRTELERIGFLQGSHQDHIMIALRQMFGRAGLTSREVRILRGIFQQMRWYIDEGSHRERTGASPPNEG